MRTLKKVKIFLVIFILSIALITAIGSCTPSFKIQKIQTSTEEKLAALGEPFAFPVIDAHTHTHFTGKEEPTSKIPQTLHEFLTQMKTAGITQAISHSGRQEGENFADLKEYGVFHCIGVGEKTQVQKVETVLKKGKARCIKIYLGYIHRYASDPIYKPYYRLAKQYDVAVVFHTGDTYSQRGKLKYADPLTLDEIAVDYPDVRFVIAHLGNPWIESAAEVAYKNPNVWLEGSALLIGDVSTLPIAQVEEFLIRPLRWAFGYIENPNKLIYGSDWPLNNMSAYLAAFKKAIPPEHWKAVFHDNAAHVFKLKSHAGPNR